MSRKWRLSRLAVLRFVARVGLVLNRLVRPWCRILMVIRERRLYVLRALKVIAGLREVRLRVRW